MALGKYSRADARKPTGSKTTVVILLGLCLLGACILMSSSSTPTQSTNLPLRKESKTESKQKIAVNLPSQYEDNSGDDAIKDASDQENDEKGYEKRDEEEPTATNDESTTKEAETDSGDDSSLTDEKSNSDDMKLNSDESESEASNSEDEKTNSEESSSSVDTNETKTKKSEEKQAEESSSDNKSEGYAAAAQSEILKETHTENGAFSTQAVESANAKKSQNRPLATLRTCNVTAGPDYIPCLDNYAALRKLHDTRHYQHRERHCPAEPPTCLVPLPQGYKTPIRWPRSREQIWYNNVPNTKLAEVKGHQNWVKVKGEYLSFPGGGTQFKNGALHYIDFVQKSLPDIAWGNRTRVILDVGCGVASFGGYLFERDVLAMSFAPKDEHEAQVQFALERGIPAISAVMGTQRLLFPSKIFDVVHCARCRVPWHIEGGKLLLELNRVLRPGGYFVWSATPVYQKKPEDVEIWKAMSKLTKAMCWDLVVVNNDKVNEVGAAIYRKPTSNTCYQNRKQNDPPLCEDNDDPDAAWNVQLEACMHKVPVDKAVRGTQWPKKWPQRLESPPYWLKSSDFGVYGKPAPEDFTADNKHWKHVVEKSYLNGLGIDWSSVRNVMDMKATYGGFAAALRKLKVWVMNVVPIDSPDTLPVIYERGLFGIYHDWCESFNTYPRSYDLLHADHIFSRVQKRCKLESLMAEVDRILRPKGTLLVRDNVDMISEVENMAKSLHWKVRMSYNKDNEGLLCVEKTLWRPTEVETVAYAVL